MNATIFSFIVLAAHTFFISPDGNDNNPGTAQKPWKTVSIAVQRLEDCDTLHFRSGEYGLDAPLSINGKKGICLIGEDGSAISGDFKVKKWKRLNDSIWTAKLKGLVDYGEPLSKNNRFEFYSQGRRQRLARWPDEGFTYSGTAKGETPAVNRYASFHGTKEGIFEYKDERISSWAKEKEPYCLGYWYWGWDCSYSRVERIDPRTGLMFIAKPWSSWGYRDGLRFYGLNLLCELDSEGEFYLDREDGTLYWYAPKEFNPGEPRTTVSTYSHKYMLEIEDCEGITICNLAFQGGRRRAVLIKNGEDVSVLDCRFSRFGDNVMDIIDGHHCRVDGCLLEELGTQGIEASGGNRRTLEGCSHTISNNIIRNFSQYRNIYAPAVTFSGVGASITHNRFENSTSSALNLGGNDIDVSYNQCFNLVRESDDQGGIDTYFNYSYRRMCFRYNHWKDIMGGTQVGAAGIRLDDIISGQQVYGNVFERCGGKGFGGVQINGGKDNWVCNNLFFDCTCAISITGRTMEYWREQITENMPQIEKVDAFGPLYRSRYPELAEPLDSNVCVNYATDNLAVNMANGLYMGASEGIKGQNNNLVNDNGKGISYYLKEETLKGYGLRPIPFDEIGPIRNKYAQ